MKLRNGFVSNSSSSSFIVAVKGKNAKATMTIEIDLEDYGDTLLTKEEVLEYFKNYYGHDSEEEILAEKYKAKHYKEMLKEIESGNRIILGEFSDESDNGLEQYLCDHGINDIKSDTVKVIQSDAGY